MYTTLYSTLLYKLSNWPTKDQIMQTCVYLTKVDVRGTGSKDLKLSIFIIYFNQVSLFCGFHKRSGSTGKNVTDPKLW